MIDWAKARERLDQAMQGVEALQALATEHGIDDIFQDNGGKVLQSLIILKLMQLPGREGNDAVDNEGRQYELKTINVLKQQQVTTHHHLNLAILDKYRHVTAWFISLYEGIILREIYRIETPALEALFSGWESRIRTGIAAGKSDFALNNPKIPLAYVANAVNSALASQVYSSTLIQTDQTLLNRVTGNRKQR